MQQHVQRYSSKIQQHTKNRVCSLNVSYPSLVDESQFDGEEVGRRCKQKDCVQSKRGSLFLHLFSRLALLDPLSTTVESVAKPQQRMSVQSQQKTFF